MLAILMTFLISSPVQAADTEEMMAEAEQRLRQVSGEVTQLEQTEKNGLKVLFAQIKPVRGSNAVMVDLGPVSKVASEVSIGDKIAVQGYYLNLRGQGLLIARDLKKGQSLSRVERKATQKSGDSYRLDPAIRKNPLWFWARESGNCVGVPSTELISEIAPLMIKRSGRQNCQLIAKASGNESIANLICDSVQLNEFYSSEDFCEQSRNKE